MRGAALALALLLGGMAQAEVRTTPGGLSASCAGLTLGIGAGGSCELSGNTVRTPVRIELLDGRTGQLLPEPTFSGAQAVDDRGTCSWEVELLQGGVDVLALPDSLAWAFRVHNTGEQQRWLEVTVSLPPLVRAPWSVWDGLTETRAVAEPVMRQGIESALPMVTAYHGNAGVVLALQPFQLLSDMRVGSEPDGAGRALYLSAKLVVDPGASEQLAFVTFPFTPDFGWRDALQRYYDLYPATFAPREGVSPHIYGLGGYIRGGGTRVDFEECRRWGFGWDWGYAPYRFTGDWYAHQQYWDGQYGDLTEYHERLRAQYAHVNQVAAGLSYINLQFIEIGLARNHFPDALRTDAHGKVLDAASPEIKRDEQVAGAFYWGNSIAEHSLRCLTELAQERGVAGISFDNAGGTGMRYGPGPEHSPGRSFQTNPEAVWAAEGIAYALHMDHVHGLSNGRHRLMVFANGPRCFLTCFRTDGAMHEAEPYYRPDHVDAMRRLLGGKPMVCWEDHPERHLDWQNMEPEVLREALRAGYDYWVMTCLHKGILPSSSRLRGNRVLQRHLPEMLAVVRAGWQPVPAMRCADELWLARFGKGTDTILSIGNATGREVNASVEVVNSYLKGGACAFAPMDGSAMRSQLFSGRTRVRLPIADRSTALLRAALSFRNLVEMVATCEGLPTDPFAPATIRWRLEAPGPSRAVAMRHWLPEGTTVAAARVDGREVPFEQPGNAVEMTCEVAAGSALEIDVRPRVTVPERAPLLDFPFLTEDRRPACQIVVADDADEVTRLAAERIAAYFEYWTAAQLKPGAGASTLGQTEGRAVIPVVTVSAAATDLPRVVLGEYGDGLCGPAGQVDGAGRLRVVEGRAPVLEVAGRDAHAVDDAVRALLGVLDERYEYYGLISGSGPFERAGLTGTVLE